MPTYSSLARGLNLWGFSASVNMQPGEALDAQDVIYRGDGSVQKHWGWRRVTESALGSRIVAHKGFTFKGKNTVVARGGNFGLADDGNDYTRRAALYSTAIALTETDFRYWDPATEAWSAAVALPGGVAVDINPKPTILILNNNAYIVGWADANLRYDPVDRALYLWGWASTGPVINAPAVGAGGTLIANATYRYRASWVDLLTGEESELGAAQTITTTAANRTVTFGVGTLAAYAGGRHFTAAGADNDVGLVMYRTGADRETFHFLALIRPDGTPAPPAGGGPGLALCTLTDNGLATDTSLKADVRSYEDPPVMNSIVEFRNQWWGLSWDNNWARVYYNDFRKENSFFERWDPRNFREIPLAEGEILTAMTRANTVMVAFTNVGAYRVEATPAQSTGDIAISIHPMDWTVGSVGPRAWTYTGGYLYWLSDRGPYRWAPGSNPEWIGKQISPLFIDSESGLCRLNSASKAEAELIYDMDTDTVRFVFACGSATTPNRHLSYMVRGAELNGDIYGGWAFHSTLAQSFDYTYAYAGLIGGVPVDPFDRKERLVWANADGFLNEYSPELQRGGLAVGAPATGVAQAGSGVALVVTLGGLYVLGDDMEGLRLEIVHTDGTIDVRTVLSNTAVNIVPDVNFSQDPTGATWYVGGIPAYWRSWVDSAGDPSSHKTLGHLWLGYNREFVAGDQTITISVSTSNDWPAVVRRTRTAALTVHRAQTMVALTGRYFTYELANSLPDQPFMITYLEPELSPVGRRR